MTIFGNQLDVWHCCWLGLESRTLSRQFQRISMGKIITYDFSVTYKDGLSTAKKEAFLNWTKKQDHMTDLMEVNESAVTIHAHGEKQDATMILPMSKKDFKGYITLKKTVNKISTR